MLNLNYVAPSSISKQETVDLLIAVLKDTYEYCSTISANARKLKGYGYRQSLMPIYRGLLNKVQWCLDNGHENSKKVFDEITEITAYFNSVLGTETDERKMYYSNLNYAWQAWCENMVDYHSGIFDNFHEYASNTLEIAASKYWND